MFYFMTLNIVNLYYKWIVIVFAPSLIVIVICIQINSKILFASEDDIR